MEIYKLKKIVGFILIILGSLSVLYFFGATAYRVAFAVFFAIFGLILMAAGFAVKNMNEKYLVHTHNPVLKVFATLTAIFLVSFIAVESLIIYHGNKNDNVDVDYLVVLGAGLWGDKPSLTLAQRLEESMKFIRNNPDTKIVLSGGMGPGETITEAEGMKRYLVDRGVNEELIIKEDKSTSTEENLKFTKELLKEIDGRENISIKIVTSDFHMFRSKSIARKNGFIAYGQPSSTHPMLIPAYYIREYMAVVKNLIIDRL